MQKLITIDDVGNNEISFLDTIYKRIGSNEAGILLYTTTTTTATKYLTKDGIVPQTLGNSIIFSDNTTNIVNIRVVGHNTTNNTFYSVERCCTIRRDGTAATTRLIGSVAIYYTIKDALFVPSITITANTTLGGLNILVNTGSSAADTINWRADIKMQIV